VPPKTPTALSRKLIRRVIKDGARPNKLRDVAFQQRILSIPKGKVATYGQVAAAAGYPLYHRAVARLLRPYKDREQKRAYCPARYIWTFDSVAAGGWGGRRD
jgi:hypothetical protein